MLHYQNLAVRGIVLFAIALINLVLAIPAMATTESFQLHSDKGYRLETSFTYDETEATKDLDFLEVRFYNSDGEMMASYDNIVDGKVRGNYFEFDYDLNTHQPLGEIDIGGESAGEMYLKGSMKRGFSLIEVKQTGEEVMDAGEWTVSK